jgi:hypothetical protein
MKSRRSFTAAGVVMMGASLTGSAYGKALQGPKISQSEQSVAPIEFKKCPAEIHQDIPAPESRIDVNVPSITGAQAVYSTPGFLHRNDGQVGELTGPKRFASVEDAKNAPFPAGCEFAHIIVADGYHVWTPRFGWMFYKSYSSVEGR